MAKLLQILIVRFKKGNKKELTVDVNSFLQFSAFILEDIAPIF